jgi:hypothetical protein
MALGARVREDLTWARRIRSTFVASGLNLTVGTGASDRWNRAVVIKLKGRAAADAWPDADSGASGCPDQCVQLAQRRPFEHNGSISLGAYLIMVTGLGSLSWSFLLRIHPSKPSQSSLTHPTWLIYHLVRLESIQVYCFEWLHLEALGDCVSLRISLVSLGGYRHLDGLVQQGSSSRGRCLSPAPIMVIMRGSWPFPGGKPKGTLVDCS